MFTRFLCSTGSLLLFGLGGCGADIHAPAVAAVPVIQSLLVAGDSVQAAWVEWRVPADSAFGPEVRPVPQSLVQLQLILPDGSSVPFIPAPSIPGRFDAAVSVSPGSRYRLTGVVAGRALSAETTVPGSLGVREPARDTVTIADACELCALPYQWAAAAAGAYFYVHSQAGPADFTEGGSTRDTIGVVRLQRRQGTSHLTVLALEGHAASFLTLTTPKSSITGVFGLFGAATRAERWIAWQ